MTTIHYALNDLDRAMDVYRIRPAMATAGRHHRVCVPTSPRPHPHLLETGLARSPFLTHHPWCQRQRPSLRWIRAKEPSNLVAGVCEVESPMRLSIPTLIRMLVFPDH